MKLMHTRLPDFYDKIDAAAKRRRLDTKISVRGLENVKTAKLASLRVGRIEDEIVEITQDEDVKEVEVILVPYNPEIHQTVVIKALREDGTCKKAILENICLSTTTCEYELFDAEEIDDRRSGNRQ